MGGWEDEGRGMDVRGRWVGGRMRDGREKEYEGWVDGWEDEGWT